MKLMAKKNTKDSQESEAVDPTEIATFTLRIEHGVKDRITQDAKDNFRSLNDHILWLIDQRLRSLKS